jgi:hypothetical protein
MSTQSRHRNSDGIGAIVLVALTLGSQRACCLTIGEGAPLFFEEHLFFEEQH